ncbi:hypothetical protein BIWAKO_04562 [Bosea sp. BIWAKO-01]|nr:hypothetical protein BIWAKO_04562 [Bosea sp. BIWAKO-01]
MNFRFSGAGAAIADVAENPTEAAAPAAIAVVMNIRRSGLLNSSHRIRWQPASWTVLQLQRFMNPPTVEAP